jgi:PAS domain S-box-containing protein
MRRNRQTLFQQGGCMAKRMAAHDWKKTPLGPPGSWPQSLRAAVRIMLTSRYAMWMAWGQDLTFFCNDAYLPTLGVKQAWALGTTARKVWEEIWPDIGPRIDRVLSTGEATWDEGLLLFLERSGYPEETYHTFSYSPLWDELGNVSGMLCVVTEETNRVLGERRLAVLRDLAARLANCNIASEVFAATARCLDEARRDFPFALGYLSDEDKKRARLVFSSGVTGGSAAAPEIVGYGSPDDPWSLSRVLQTSIPSVVEDLPARFGDLPGGPWSKPPDRAILLPLMQTGRSTPAGIFIAALNPFRQLDEAYRSFAELFAGQLMAGISNANAYEAERRRAEALAEIDRAKTLFFSNVSHEFRTPLALMLGPLADTLSQQSGPLLQRAAEELAMVHRNGLRLLKLVNTLLDFSRIEAGRVDASFVPTDLAAFTTDLASTFRSAIEKAGLTLAIDAPPLAEAAYVDRDMWEKIVLNLISNAFKFTLEGGMTVRLWTSNRQIHFAVEDTGSGIPKEELPRVFERFHRVEGAKGRTNEGSGIGLALVQELIKIHGGHVTVESEVGKGSTFTVSIPTGKNHLPPDRISAERTLALTTIGTNAFIEEALRWLPDVAGSEALEREAFSLEDSDASLVSTLSPQKDVSSLESRARILVVDDNADMRNYIRRLLSERFEVNSASDGVEALEAARRHKPALVVSDVMMPNLDGFGLLRALRSDSELAGLPVILLSARAGEEATLEGIQAGADDYLIKPFSARELLARVQAQIERKRFEQKLAAAEQRLRTALATAKMATWEWDLVTGEINASSTIADVFGLRPGQTFVNSELGFSLVHPDERARYRALVEEAARRGEDFRTEFRIVRPCDGRVALLEAHGQAIRDTNSPGIRMVGLVTDITERRQAQAALQRSEERLAFSVKAAELGTFFCPMPLGKIIWNNKGKEHFWLPPDAEVDFELFYSILHPEDRERTRAAVKRTVFDQEPYDIEYRTVAPDGRVRWVRAKGRAYYDPDGNPTRFDGVTLDITELKRVERFREETLAAERAAREEAERVSRMKDEFLATLSHELRTPLNAILGWSHILSRNPDGPETAREGLQAIERNARAQTQMIEDLLDMSRIIAGKVRLDVQRLALADVVTAAVQSVLPSAELKGVRLLTVLDQYAGPVAGDANRLQQVVWNLLNNAIKFTHRGGQVQVVLERVNSHLELSISDTGEGIAPEFLPHLFERFRQADASTTRRHGGLGLGLSIVKQLVELHGGTVRAKSPGLGKGSTFTITLPVSIVEMIDLTTRRGSDVRKDSQDLLLSDPPSLHGITVLVVDDDPDARTILKRILNQGGAHVITAESAREALQILPRARPTLLVSDIGMPQDDGYYLIRQVRTLSQQEGGATPAVALTAFARSEDRQRALRAGYHFHVAKPVEPSELLTVCASLASQLRTPPA